MTSTTKQPAAADEPAPGKTIRIVHTRAEGTLIEGSVKGDGVWEIVRTWFRYSGRVGIFILGSRDKAANRWTIDAAAKALRAGGFTVEVDIDDGEGRSFAEAEAERNGRGRVPRRAVRRTSQQQRCGR
jgi:hypothetical protein